MKRNAAHNKFVPPDFFKISVAENDCKDKMVGIG